jgi:aminoglycoside phosphotransferase (APT) family kinase protein
MSDSLPTKLTLDQITTMCRRGFGRAAKLESVQELGGGTFNETYLVELAGKTRVILRVAPPPTADVYWDDVALMRREHHILPFFASIATLMPKIIMTDFTHQVVERDYMFQTCMDGERWSDIEDELTLDENTELWHQCGKIVRRIHETTGEHFGYPYPGRQFMSWGETILDRFARISESMLAHHLEVTAFRTISDIARANAARFDEIHAPHLLHGDLWTFNLLVTHGNNHPAITGVLDVDRAWWGDPMADWIMFLLVIRRGEPEWRQWLSAFYDGYGLPASDESAQFRQEVYRAMHIGTCAVGSARNGNKEDIARARRELCGIAQALPVLSL